MLPLSPDLEHLILGAILQGLLPLKSVKEEELSKEGRYVYQSIQTLGKPEGVVLAPKSIFITATDVLGGDKTQLRAFLKHLQRVTRAGDSAKLLELIRQKRLLLTLINLAGEQLGSGRFDMGCFTDLIARDDHLTQLSPVAEGVGGTLPSLPSGMTIPGLPLLSQVSGGVFGFWAIGGEPGVGKSTLGLQIACYLQKHMPVIYYDFEQGQENIIAHLGIAFQGNVKKVKQATRQLYIRDSLKTLGEDLRQFPPPATIVVDSIQNAPTSAEFRRSGIDQWLTKFKALKIQGYTVIGISEVGRDLYTEMRRRRGNPARMGGYKESGGIEYAADIGIQLFKSREDPLNTDVYVVKNRHRPEKGEICQLERVNEWWFAEVS